MLNYNVWSPHGVFRLKSPERILLPGPCRPRQQPSVASPARSGSRTTPQSREQRHIWWILNDNRAEFANIFFNKENFPNKLGSRSKSEILCLRFKTLSLVASLARSGSRTTPQSREQRHIQFLVNFKENFPNRLGSRSESEILWLRF